ncbi:RNA-directed DNA polymerase, eukaryota, reverse transcriptase zinc-binding domain protein [Tanacetum coccineum]|uniref:RNA-directed DNA polymerase, eukaryota, reverse transcriptase zinc-binding domain protein n=1 Tax=Tanacetum coccineum TaxID=301880 RepID=A0ABQ4ZDX5_9ASTR
MSKLDQIPHFGCPLLGSCPNISAIALDRFLSDHRPILLREVCLDYGPIPFRFYHYWFDWENFDKFVLDSWNELSIHDSNAISKFMKKLKCLKEKIRLWTKMKKESSKLQKMKLKKELSDMDILIDNKCANQEIINKRSQVMHSLQDLEKLESMEVAQKVKIKWSIAGDENSKYYHGLLNKSRNQLSIRGVLSDGAWVESPAVANIDIIVNALKCFHLASGLRMNLHKSKLMGIAIENDKIARAANKIGCLTLKSPFSYLGIKVGGLMSRVNSWDKVVDSLYARLSKWKMMTAFYRFLLKFKEMEAVRVIFLLGLRPSMRTKCGCVKWNRVLASKEKGGLGVSSYFALNRALMIKWTWRFRNDGNSLWSKFIRAMYGSDGKLRKHVNRSHPSIWLDIVNEVHNLKNKNLVSLSLMNENNCAETERRGLRRAFSELKAILDGLLLSSAKDRWSWSIDGSEEFSVASTRRLLDDHLLQGTSVKTRWVKEVPIKINIMAWKVRFDYLPSRFNLSKRGLDILDICCPTCTHEAETTNPHLLFLLLLARDIP